MKAEVSVVTSILKYHVRDENIVITLYFSCLFEAGRTQFVRLLTGNSCLAKYIGYLSIFMLINRLQGGVKSAYFGGVSPNGYHLNEHNLHIKK